MGQSTLRPAAILGLCAGHAWRTAHSHARLVAGRRPCGDFHCVMASSKSNGTGSGAASLRGEHVRRAFDGHRCRTHDAPVLHHGRGDRRGEWPPLGTDHVASVRLRWLLHHIRFHRRGNRRHGQLRRRHCRWTGARDHRATRRLLRVVVLRKHPFPAVVDRHPALATARALLERADAADRRAVRVAGASRPGPPAPEAISCPR